MFDNGALLCLLNNLAFCELRRDKKRQFRLDLFEVDDVDDEQLSIIS
jgi:hypothetical protein